MSQSAGKSPPSVGASRLASSIQSVIGKAGGDLLIAASVAVSGILSIAFWTVTLRMVAVQSVGEVTPVYSIAISNVSVGLGGLLLATLSRPLDAMTLGEDAAEALGMRLSRVRRQLIIGTALVVGASTAVAGTIGFVGLVVPHLLRPLVGAMPGRLLGASALGGAAMVLLADILVRIILPEADLKLGVLTAFIGAPLFLHLIYQTRRELA